MVYTTKITQSIVKHIVLTQIGKIFCGQTSNQLQAFNGFIKQHRSFRIVNNITILSNTTNRQMRCKHFIHLNTRHSSNGQCTALNCVRISFTTTEQGRSQTLIIRTSSQSPISTTSSIVYQHRTQQRHKASSCISDEIAGIHATIIILLNFLSNKTFHNCGHGKIYTFTIRQLNSLTTTRQQTIPTFYSDTVKQCVDSSLELLRCIKIQFRDIGHGYLSRSVTIAMAKIVHSNNTKHITINSSGVSKFSNTSNMGQRFEGSSRQQGFHGFHNILLNIKVSPHYWGRVGVNNKLQVGRIINTGFIKLFQFHKLVDVNTSPQLRLIQRQAHHTSKDSLHILRSNFFTVTPIDNFQGS